MRITSQTLFLRDKKLEEGTVILIPYGEMLADEKLFGRDADVFKWDRFLKDGSLAQSTHFTPFGGGAGRCPGRFLAQQEILAFVALVLGRFDLGLAEEGNSIPQLDKTRPSTGFLPPVGAQDVILRIRQAV